MWYWFLELSSQRTGNGFGPNAIQWSEILAWQQIRGIRLKQWELRAIVSVDRSYLIRCGELAELNTDEVSEQPLNAEVFDRMFK